MDLAEVAIARVCGVAVEIAMYDCVVSRGGPLLGLYIGGQVSRSYTSFLGLGFYLSFLADDLQYTPWSL